MTNLEFVKIALRDRNVGALTVSSRFVVERVVREVPADARFVVEYGPGSGVTTRALLATMPKDSKLVAIEQNKAFSPALGKIKDSRLKVVWGDALEFAKILGQLCDTSSIDMVIANIPFSLLTPGERESVFADTHNALKDGGVFLVYQYYPFFVMPRLKKIFTRVSLRAVELRNLPPYFIIRAEK